MDSKLTKNKYLSSTQMVEECTDNDIYFTSGEKLSSKRMLNSSEFRREVYRLIVAVCSLGVHLGQYMTRTGLWCIIGAKGNKNTTDQQRHFTNRNIFY